MPSVSPPKPALAFRVGIIGHRWDKLRGFVPSPAASGTAALEQTLGKTVGTVLALVAERLDRAVATGLFAEGPSRRDVLSGLAEGTDRIGAHAGLDAGFTLTAMLPFAATTYRRDFDERWAEPTWSRPGAQAEFDRLLGRATSAVVLDGEPDRTDRYLPLGKSLLAHADLLVVVWDGHTSRGPGGTGDLVAQARDQEIPIVRIDPAAPTEAWLEAPLEPDLGRERGLARLARRIDDLILPPDLTGLAGEDQRQTRLGFFGEQPPQTSGGGAYRALTDHFVRWHGGLAAVAVPTWLAWARAAWSAWRRQPEVATLESPGSAWLATAAVAREVGNEPAVMRTAVLHRWLDELATWYGVRYRTCFTMVFSLAWIAAVAAVVGLIAHIRQWPSAWLWSGLELATLVSILSVSEWGKQRRYHTRWLEYRQLAEQLRHLGFLWPIGAATSFSRLAAAPATDDPRVRWTGWLYRAAVRDLGVGFREFDKGHASRATGRLQHHEISEQQRYHDQAADRLRRIHHAVHLRTEGFFWAAAFVAVLHLVDAGHWIAEHLFPGPAAFVAARAQLISGLLTVLSVFLPARAAALHGWAGFADFQGGALRSAQIAGRLERIGRALAGDRVQGSIRLGELAVEAAEAMEWELAAWWATSASRPITRV